MKNPVILWTELLGFDPNAPDCGASKYVERLGFVPEMISLFLWGCDFVHLHDGMTEDRDFPPDIGTYLDIYFEGPKVPGMVWSKFKLRTLVQKLHTYGIKVLFSIFPSTLHSRFHHEWVEEHHEVQNCLAGELKRDPSPINPLKRFADGTYYEDFLLAKVEEVIRDYDFDGWHLCDGYNHPWYQLFQSDFSDDMLEQSGLTVPADCISPDERSEYIWKNLRREWIDFHVRRNTEHFRKIVNFLHGLGKIVTAHTCWTRDPVDSIYRYGMDYRQIDELGFDALVLECANSTELNDHLFGHHYAVPFDNVANATALLTRATLKKTPLYEMDAIQDLTEDYSDLRQAPAHLERSIFELGYLGVIDETGFQRCFTGRQICLADSETKSEWEWLQKCWEHVEEVTPIGVDGAVVVWCPEAMDAELAIFLADRPALTAPILYRLLAKGANIRCITTIDNLNCITENTVLAINPGLWPVEARRKLSEHTCTPVVSIGITAPTAVNPHPCQYSEMPEPLNFLVEQPDHDLPACEYERVMNQLPGNFFTVIHQDTNSDAPYYRFYGYRLGEKTWRVLVINTFWKYIYGELVTDTPIETIKPANTFRWRPFWLEPRPDGKTGNLIYLRVSPLNAAIVDVTLRSKS